MMIINIIKDVIENGAVCVIGGIEMVDTLNEEIGHHIGCLRKANNTDDYCHGLTELEYHMAKVIDRLLIATGHARTKIRLRLGEDRGEISTPSDANTKR